MISPPPFNSAARNAILIASSKEAHADPRSKSISQTCLFKEKIANFGPLFLTASSKSHSIIEILLNEDIMALRQCHTVCT